MYLLKTNNSQISIMSKKRKGQNSRCFVSIIEFVASLKLLPILSASYEYNINSS